MRDMYSLSTIKIIFYYKKVDLDAFPKKKKVDLDYS